MFNQVVFSMEPVVCETKDVVISLGADYSPQPLLALRVQDTLGLKRHNHFDDRQAQVNKAILLLAEAADQKNKYHDQKIKLQEAQLKQQDYDRKKDRKYTCCSNCLTLCASLASTGVAIWAAVIASDKSKAV